MRTVITGAYGSLGRRLRQLIPDCYPLDIDSLDVTDPGHCATWITHQVDTVYHLAGAKHAPDGELDPAHVAKVNIDGTINVLAAATRVGAKVIVASTCKACNPETAYGASKLIAERLTLNAGGVVCRFHNIPESDGNVFRHWETIPDSDPIPVTDCWRYFIPMEHALKLLLTALDLPTGRYMVDPGAPRFMPDVADELYPGRAKVRVPRRRGDRWREPFKACNEHAEPRGDHIQIFGTHDPDPGLPLRVAA